MNKLFFFIIIFLFLTNDFLATYKKNKKNLTYVHISRTGGSSIEYEGYKNGFYWGKYYFYNNHMSLFNDLIIVLFNKNYKFITNNYLIRLCFKPKKWKHHTPPKYLPYFYENKNIFTIVRNPYDRLISAYKFVTNNTSIEGLNKFIKQNLSNYNNKTINDKTVSTIFIPQSEYLYKNITILKYENLQQDFSKFLKENDIEDIKLPRLNKTNKTDLSYKNISNENLELINNLYYDDFMNFEYKIYEF